jgi:hypothetical protein
MRARAPQVSALLAESLVGEVSGVSETLLMVGAERFCEYRVRPLSD